MHDVTVKRLHEIVGGRLRLATLPPRHGELARVRGVAIDSRLVRRGDVFWGLPGARFDGSHFAGEAYARGAEGAVVGQQYIQPWPGCWSLEVADSLAALETLARWNRGRFGGRVAAVTGSVGKTTTREMIRAVVERRLCGTASPRNCNDRAGVPLSMLSIDPRHDFAVLELASDARGEIGHLAALCGPHVGVITRAADAQPADPAGSAAARAKAEMLAALPSDGWAVLDGDDPALRTAAATMPEHVVWFGRGLENDLVAANVECGSGRLSFDVDGQRMQVAVWGRHHLASALAAIAVGRIFGLSDAEIRRGLADFEPPPMRCQITRALGATLIDDTHNASPLAMRAALELLRDFDAPGRRIVVVGDMRELGDAAQRLHRHLGDQVVSLCGADWLVACGEHSAQIVEGARAAGMPQSRARAVADPREALQPLAELVAAGDVVLVKGSQAPPVRRLVEALQGRAAPCAA
jgi:UDP-N-acetylmuramoyl-tripeptide--D-alanyl-D-alanine ligase